MGGTQRTEEFTTKQGSSREMIKGIINTSILISTPSLKQQNSIFSCCPPQYCRHNREVFTSLTIIFPHVLQWLGSPQVWVVTFGSWNGWHSDPTAMGHHSSSDSTTKSTASHFSQLQSHPAFGKGRSTLWRCYISKQWGLGLKRSIGSLSSKRMTAGELIWKSRGEGFCSPGDSTAAPLCTEHTGFLWPWLLPEPLKSVKPKGELSLVCVKTASGLDKYFSFPWECK